MELLLKYFPHLTQEQIQQFSSLHRIYSDWNEKINVISRKDIKNLYERHILHSLSIAKFVQFKSATKIMDLGTGGGFPGVPLAILFPDTRFHLVDSIAKKLKVIDSVKEEIRLKNIFTFHARAEHMEFQYDFVVTRAVATLTELLNWTKGKYLTKDHHPVQNGLICLKGGSLEEEISNLKSARKIPISNFIDQPFFKDKFIVHIGQ